MNKQPICAEKLLKWIESDKRAEAFWIDGLDSTVAFDNLSDAIDAGELAPDPLPLPTIKPGDKVRHSDLGLVRVMSDPMITVLKDKEEFEVYLADLEVSHD